MQKTINKNSLATHLIKTIFGLYLLIAVSVTMLQLITEFYLVKESIFEELKKMEKTYGPGLSSAVWNFDQDGLDAILKGMIENSVIKGVKVVYINGNTAGKIGLVKEEDTENEFSNDFKIDFDLSIINSRGETNIAGKTFLFSDNSVVVERIKYSFFLMIINSIIKTIALWIIFRVFLRKILTDPLNRFTRDVGQIDLDSLGDSRIEVHTEFENELKVLEKTFNQMLAKLQKTLNKQHESENFLRISESRYRQFFENVPVSLWEQDYSRIKVELDHYINEGVTDFKGFFREHPDLLLKFTASIITRDVNKATLSMYKATDKEMLFQNINKIFGVEYQDVLEKEICAMSAGDLEFASETVLYDLNGESLFVNIRLSVAPGCEEDWSKVFVSMSDISKRTMAEKKLRETQNELELRVEERTLDLLDAKDAAEKANRIKGEFLAKMSHEIRTPMNAIIGLGHLVLDTELSANQKDYLNKMQGSANALLRIINDILDFSKIEAEQMEVEYIEFNLDKVLVDLSNVISIQAYNKGLTILFDVDPKAPMLLLGDPLRLGQVLLNLANNAIKFTEKGNIIVKIKLMEETREFAKIQFSINDSGIGLSKDQIGNLFKSFSQADSSTTRKYGGTGLGLTISKRLVEMMGGNIDIASEPGKGSNFFFKLPFGIVPHQERFNIAPELKEMKVLVIDDTRISRENLKYSLEAFSFKVDTAESGVQAIEKIENSSDDYYKLILVDWRMPGLDGLETIKQLKKRFSAKGSPVFFLITTFTNDEIINEAEKNGISTVIQKPVGRSVLFKTVMEEFGYATQKKKTSTKKMFSKSKSLSRIAGARILLAEDNALNQLVATELLEKENFFVDVANNGLEAVIKAESKLYDLVLMDIQMPELDGIQASKKIRKIKNKDQKNVPVIAMTAHAMVGDKEKSLQAGMNDHITKPIDPQELYATLIKWIKPGNRETPEIKKTDKVKQGQKTLELKLINLSGISSEVGLKHANNNQELYKKLLIKFYHDFNDAIETVEKSHHSGNIDQSSRLVHTLKGVSGTIGAISLQEKAVALEDSINKGEKEKLPERISNMKAEFEIVLNSLQILLQEENSKNSDKNKSIQKGTKKELLEILSEIKPFIKQHKPKLYKKLLIEIEEKEWPESIKGQVNEFCTQLKKYKYKQALQLLENMLS
jgi:signal transduction histidine kinase/DNA-binding response OmpR family regulator